MTKFFGIKTLIICIMPSVLAKLYFATILFQFWHEICQVGSVIIVTYHALLE